MGRQQPLSTTRAARTVDVWFGARDTTSHERVEQAGYAFRVRPTPQRGERSTRTSRFASRRPGVRCRRGVRRNRVRRGAITDALVGARHDVGDCLRAGRSRFDAKVLPAQRLPRIPDTDRDARCSRPTHVARAFEASRGRQNGEPSRSRARRTADSPARGWPATGWQPPLRAHGARVVRRRTRSPTLTPHHGPQGHDVCISAASPGLVCARWIQPRRRSSVPKNHGTSRSWPLGRRKARIGCVARTLPQRRRAASCDDTGGEGSPRAVVLELHPC